jgi:plasmid maintenance system antidote protein VapI
MSNFVRPFQSKIKDFLDDKGYSKTRIARKIGISPVAFYAMLNNKRIMTADILLKLCNTLEVSAEFLANYEAEREWRTGQSTFSFRPRE